MSGISYSMPRFQAIDLFGRPMVGAQLHTYQNKTTTPAPTWQDKDQSAYNTNPIILDARGEAVIWLDPEQVYTFVLRGQLGELVWSQDDVVGAASGQDLTAFIERLADPIDPNNGGAMIAIPTPAGGTTLSEWTGRRKSLKDFGAIMDGTTDDSAAINAAAASGRAIYYDEGVARNVTGAEPAVRYGPGFIKRPDGIILPAQPFEHAPDVRRILSGMEVDRLSDTQLRIYTGCCTDSTGRLLMRLTANLTVDISTTGLNGLDTGTPETNAGYQIYMVMNTDTGQVGAVVSKAITYGGVTMPAGFSRARKLPWAFVLRGGVIPAFLISGWPKAVTNYTSFATVTDWAVAENITSLSFTPVDFSEWMPDAARIALLQCVVTHDGVGAAGSAFMRVSGSQGVTGEEIAAVSGAGDRVVTQVESRVTSTRTLTFRVTGGAVLSIYMQGYVNVEPS